MTSEADKPSRLREAGILTFFFANFIALGLGLVNNQCKNLKGNTDGFQSSRAIQSALSRCSCVRQERWSFFMYFITENHLSHVAFSGDMTKIPNATLLNSGYPSSLGVDQNLTISPLQC